MPTFTMTSNSTQYSANSGSYTSGSARQGYYGTTYYKGYVQFGSTFNLTNVRVTGIRVSFTFGGSGAAGSKTIHFYNSNPSGSAVATYTTVGGAYNRTETTSTLTSGAFYNWLYSRFVTSRANSFYIYNGSTKGSGSSYGNDYLGITACTIYIDYAFLSSEGNLNKIEVQTGNAITLTINANDPTYAHKVTWTCGSTVVGPTTINPGVTSYTFTVPQNWVNLIPSTALTKQASVTLSTWTGTSASDTQLGDSVTYSFSIHVPLTSVPTIGAVSLIRQPESGGLSATGHCICGFNNLKVTTSSVVPTGGATISSYRIEIKNISNSSTIASYTGTSSQLTTGIIGVPGTYKAYVTVTDSRGLISSTVESTTTMQFYSYSAPTISGLSAQRCNTSGVLSQSGTRFLAKATSITFSPLDGTNSLTQIKLTVSDGSAEYNKTITPSSFAANGFTGTNPLRYETPTNAPIGYGSNNLDTDKSYIFKITVTDSRGNSSTESITINSQAYILHIRNDGAAIGLGCAAKNGDQGYHTITLGWDLIVSGGSSFLSYTELTDEQLSSLNWG